MVKRSVTALCTETTKPEIIFCELKTMKKAKITSQAHDFKNHGHIYNVEIFISFNPELQVKNTEFAITN